MYTTGLELITELSKEPDEVKENEDKSQYVPISVVQSTLDKLFLDWSWDLERDSFGKNFATGKGVLSVVFPSGREVIKSGTAGIALSGDMKLDYPRLEAMCLLNAAKKLGNRFGRNLNRQKEDAPLPVTQLRNNQNGSSNAQDESYEATLELVKEAASKEEALSIMESNGWKWNDLMKKIANSKP